MRPAPRRPEPGPAVPNDGDPSRGATTPPAPSSLREPLGGRMRSIHMPLAAIPALLALVAVIAAGCGGAATPAPSIPAGAVVVHAKNLAFDTKVLNVPAGTSFSLALVNEDGDMHNIAIRTKPGFDGDVVFRFDPFSAATKVFTVGPIPQGTYYFLCEVHPNMSGTVIAN
jgi:plastocyanin